MTLIINPDEIVGSTISNFIEQQFPRFFRANGPVFVAFLKAYYEWLESSTNPLYYARRFYSITDIDTTLEQFIVSFKEKYLKNIQLTTKSDTRQLIKHSLDIYRSKGTERCVELLFQLVYNSPVKFYYPSQDLFKVSDGQWYIPRYLELSLSENNIQLQHKEVIGLNSGATAFVEDVVRYRIKNKLLDVAYISSLQNDFETHEKIRPNDNSLDIDLCPILTGSLSSIAVVDGQQQYVVGDIVDVLSNYGIGAKARVANTSEDFGLVTLSLNNGGYGYAANADVYISNSQLILENISLAANTSSCYCSFSDAFTEPMAYVNYISANGLFQVGDSVSTYYGNSSVMGTGQIMTHESINSTAGTLLLSILTGNLNNTIFSSANSITASIALSNGYTDATATGTYIANNNEMLLTCNTANDYILNEYVYQGPASAIITSIFGSNVTINTISGLFRKDLEISGNTSGARAIPSAVQMTIGLVSVSSNTPFIASPYSYIYSNKITAKVGQADNDGAALSLSIANSFDFQSVARYNTDTINPKLSTQIGAFAYNFAANTSANLIFATLGTSFTLANLTVGKLTNIIQTGIGRSYIVPPIVKIDQPQIRPYFHHNMILNLVDDGIRFPVGEVITQAATGAVGTVQFSNSSILYIERDFFHSNNMFVVTSNSTTKISGNTTAFSANISMVAQNNYSSVSGHNAEILRSFITGNGSIVSLSVEDSGFGYIENEIVTLNGETGTSATGQTHLVKQGNRQGYYRKKGGFLSDQKKLFDGDYWQNFSYEIISKILMNKYSDMIKQITHPAGTKMFGRFVHTNSTNTSINMAKANILLS